MTSKAVSTLKGKVVRGFAAFALACAAMAPMGSFAAGTGSSMRIMTYNIFMLTIDLGWPWGEVNLNTNKFGMDYEKRAELIANKALIDDNDIIVFNEAWGDKSKDPIVKVLKQKYPYYIRQVRGDVPNLAFAAPAGILDIIDFLSKLPPLGPAPAHPQLADSGLMIFSKYPFEPFDGPSPTQLMIKTIDGQNGYKFGVPVPWGGQSKEVTAIAYPYYSGSDGMASKAVAMVRVKNPNDGMISNIAFTHMNADEVPGDDADAVAARADQFKSIQFLIDGSLTQTEIKTQPLYVLGDLNVRGANEKLMVNSAYYAKDGIEWKNVFATKSGVANGFFACGPDPCDASHVMVDSQGVESAPQDLSFTNYTDQARLDYILHNKPSMWVRDMKDPVGLCMQYIAKAREMIYDAKGNLTPDSDHLPVRADFNIAAPHCSPTTQDPVLGPVALSFANNATQTYNFGNGAFITNPGNMQWYRIDDAGDYFIKVEATDLGHVAGIGYEVYSASDMTLPLKPFYGNVGVPRKGDEFLMPKPPYYIRVFAKNPATGNPDRTTTGNYTIRIHQQTGLTPDDAIAFGGALTWPREWNTANDAAYWYNFHTRYAVSSNGAPRKPQTVFRLNVPTLTKDQYSAELYHIYFSGGQKIYQKLNTVRTEIDYQTGFNLSKKDPNLTPEAEDYQPRNYPGPLAGLNTTVLFTADPSDLPGMGPNGADSAETYYVKLIRGHDWMGAAGTETSYLQYGTTLKYMKPDKIFSSNMVHDWPYYDNIDLQYTYDLGLPGNNKGWMEKPRADLHDRLIIADMGTQVSKGAIPEPVVEYPRPYVDDVALNLWANVPTDSFWVTDGVPPQPGPYFAWPLRMFTLPPCKAPTDNALGCNLHLSNQWFYATGNAFKSDWNYIVDYTILHDQSNY